MVTIQERIAVVETKLDDIKTELDQVKEAIDNLTKHLDKRYAPKWIVHILSWILGLITTVGVALFIKYL